MRAESTTFVSSVLGAKPPQDDITNFVLSYTGVGSMTTTRWSAFFLHSSKQFFFKSPSTLPLDKASLVCLLDLAEELGAVDAFACVPKCGDCERLAFEFAGMDFKLLSPRLQPLKEYVLLRFTF
jgi:hypothetical protein